MAELAQPMPRPATLAARADAGTRVWQRLDVRTWSLAAKFVLALSVLYIAKQVLFVVIFPPFTGHDEVAHYSYIRTIATEGRLPRLVNLDEWRTAYLASDGNWQPIEDRFPDALYPYGMYSLDWIYNQAYVVKVAIVGGVYYPSGANYAANHPPLYYTLMTPVYWLTEGLSPEGQQYVIRAATIPFGLATVLLAFLMTWTLFPGDTFLAMTVPTFVAFQTQVSYEAAMVNNDVACIALVSLVLYLLVRGLRDRFPARLCIWIGVAFGLALLAKGTSVIAGPLIALALLVAWWPRNRCAFVTLVKRGLLIAIPTVILAGPWYLWLYHIYGNFTGFKQISELQYWNRPAGTFFGMLFSRDFALMRFKETWGEFGWRKIHLDTTLLWAIGLPLIVAFVGLGQYGLAIIRRGGHDADPVERPARWQIWGVALMLVTCVVAYLAVIQFGTQFALTQARYYFPAINAAALLLMLGLRTLIPHRWHGFGQAGVLAAMVVLNLVVFTQYVIPYWHLVTY